MTVTRHVSGTRDPENSSVRAGFYRGRTLQSPVAGLARARPKAAGCCRTLELESPATIKACPHARAYFPEQCGGSMAAALRKSARNHWHFRGTSIQKCCTRNDRYVSSVRHVDHPEPFRRQRRTLTEVFVSAKVTAGACSSPAVEIGCGVGRRTGLINRWGAGHQAKITG